jgi:hypothetical protein
MAPDFVRPEIGAVYPLSWYDPTYPNYMRKITKNGMNQYPSNIRTDLYPPKLPIKLTTPMITTPRTRDTL